MSENEKQKLAKYIAFYEKGDLMDQLLVEREVELLKRFCLSKKMS